MGLTTLSDGLQKIVACCQLYLAVLLVSPVFGTVSSLHLTCLTNFFLHCPGPHSNLLFMHTKWHLAQPVEIVASCYASLYVTKYKRDRKLSQYVHYLQSSEFVNRHEEEEEDAVRSISTYMYTSSGVLYVLLS